MPTPGSCTEPGVQLVKKASQSSPPKGGEKNEIIFCRGVYLAENTSQAASVEFVRLKRINYARSRLQIFVEKPSKVFRQSKPGSCTEPGVGVFLNQSLVSAQERKRLPAGQCVPSLWAAAADRKHHSNARLPPAGTLPTEPLSPARRTDGEANHQWATPVGRCTGFHLPSRRKWYWVHGCKQTGPRPL